jgi:mannosyl-oligosaccharide glucosidase
MGAPSSRTVATGAAFLLLLLALPSAFLYLTSSTGPAASRAALLNLKPFSARRCPPSAAPPLRVFMYDLPPRFHVAMMTGASNADADASSATAGPFPAWPPTAGGIRRQHSVEYWMMASLQDWGGGGGGLLGSERREAVRVRDPDDAEAFFVPFFSSLSFNVHGRNMTDPDTEADRLLQVPRFLDFPSPLLIYFPLTNSTLSCDLWLIRFGSD